MVCQEGDRVEIAKFQGFGPYYGTVIQADDEKVEVICDSEEGIKHFNTVYSDHFDLITVLAEQTNLSL